MLLKIPAALAREGDDALVAELVTAKAQEPVGGDAAAKVGAQLLLDETRCRLPPVSGAGEECFELGLDSLIEQRSVGLPRLVLRGAEGASRAALLEVGRARLRWHGMAVVRAACRAGRGYGGEQRRARTDVHTGVNGSPVVFLLRPRPPVLQLVSALKTQKTALGARGRPGVRGTSGRTASFTRR